MIKNGLISPDLTVKFRYYQIIGPYENGENPHLELAELDLENEQAVTEFCSKWGILGVHRRDLVFKGGDRPLNRRTLSAADDSLLTELGLSSWREYHLLVAQQEESESLNSFKLKAREFQRMVQIKSAVFPKIDQAKVAELSGNASKLKAELTGWFDHELENQIQLRTRLYSTDKGMQEEQGYYAFDDLFTGLVLLLRMDLQKGKFTRQCQKHDCKKWFNTANARQTYCCSEHKETAKSLRKYHENRDRINQARREKYKKSKMEASK